MTFTSTTAPLMCAALLLATPAVAQDHAAHRGHGAAAPETDSAPASPAAVDPNAGRDMPAAMPTAQPGRAAMGPGEPMTASPGPDMETPAPAEAGSGPPRAADAVWGAEAMQASRRDLQQTHGDYPLFWFQADRAELQVRDGGNGYLWDVQGYYGGTISRMWFKSEGEGQIGKPVDAAEFQGLYSRAVAPFFDLQAGVRQDVAGPGTTYAVFGVQGLARYRFEVDAAMFLSHRGDLTARVEAELDQRITQRLILQPRAEVNVSAQDVPVLGIGAGLDSVEVGLRLRYEIIREFAPYIGVEQNWRVGRSADFARAAGDDPAVTSFVVGVRLWF